MSRRQTVLRSIRRAFTQVEIIAATLISSGLLLAALQTVSSSISSRRINSEDGRGYLLAQGLLDEIVAQPYTLTPSTTPTPGGNRTSYDEVCDYSGFSESPPVKRDGSAIANSTGWTRSVTLEYVLASNLTTTSMSDTGVRRVTVTTQRGGGTRYTASTVVVNASTRKLYE